MRSSFPGYYEPTDGQLAELWSEATFVFDTNVLLHLYRVPDATRLQMLDAFSALSGRVWLPHQVGMEYQSRRLATIESEHQSALKIVKDMRSSFDRYLGAVDKSQLADRGVTDAEVPLLEMKELAGRVEEVVQRSLSGQLAPSDHDHVRDAIDRIFAGRVGQPPGDQDAINQWNAAGAERFPLKRPPGYEDAGKASSPVPSFYAQGLVFERQYGDLYLWFEILEYARDQGISKLVFVTQDRKEDWWKSVPSAAGPDVLLPHPALADEIRRVAGVEHFWMYQLQGFLEAAPRHLDVSVSRAAIEDVNRAADSAADADKFALSEPPRAEGTRLSLSDWERRFAKLDVESARLLDLVSREAIADCNFKAEQMLGGAGPAGPEVSLIAVVAADLVLKDPATFISFMQGWLRLTHSPPASLDIYVVQPIRESDTDIVVAALIRQALTGTKILKGQTLIHYVFVSGRLGETPRYGAPKLLT